MNILVKGKVETVSLDRVKPAHLDSEPAICTEKQRKTQNNMKNSKNTTTVRREPALKQNSEKKRAEPKAKTKTETRSVVVQHSTNLATSSQHNANRVNLPQRFTPYVAPHSRIPAISRANGSDGGLRTYSRVPLHLRVKTPNSNETIKPPKCSKQFEYRQRRPNCTRRNRKTNQCWTKNPHSSTFRTDGPRFSSA